MDTEIKEIVDEIYQGIVDEIPTKIFHRTVHQEEVQYFDPKEKMTDFGRVLETGHKNYKYVDEDFESKIYTTSKYISCPICGREIGLKFEEEEGIFIKKEDILNDKELRKDFHGSKYYFVIMTIIGFIISAFFMKRIDAVFLVKLAIAFSIGVVIGLLIYVVTRLIESYELKKYDYFLFKKYKKRYTNGISIRLISRLFLLSGPRTGTVYFSHFFSFNPPFSGPPGTPTYWSLDTYEETRREIPLIEIVDRTLNDHSGLSIKISREIKSLDKTRKT